MAPAAFGFWVVVKLLNLLLSLAFLQQQSTSAVAQQPQGFISIDCGASMGHTATTGLDFQADDFFSTGVPVSLDGIYQLDMRTARSFPANSSPDKNCYEVPVQRNQQYLVRAWFLIGALAAPLVPPSGILSFNLALGTTIWDTVSINSTGDGTFYKPYEAVVYAPTPLLSVCVIRTEAGTAPFISSLELRPLDPNFYLGRIQANSAGLILSLQSRWNYGETNTTFRYPDDQYDRRWTPYSLPNDEQWDSVKVPGYPNASQRFEYSDFYQWDRPPSIVMQSAASAHLGSNYILGNNYYLDTTRQIASTRVYASLFFAEIIDLAAQGASREVNFSCNFVAAPPPSLNLQSQYGLFGVKQFGGDFNVTPAMEGILVFTLRPSNASQTYYPILNAFEVYLVLDVVQGTRPEDATALGALKTSFNLSQWTGDACSPVPWDEIKCADLDKAVTWLDLSGKGLSGAIPNDISSFTELTYLNLANNNFSGPLPTWVQELKALQTLDVSNNSLSGSFSSDITRNINKFRYDGNPQLSCINSGSSICQVVSGPVQPPPPPPPSSSSTGTVDKSKKSNLVPIVAAIVGSLVCLLLVGGTVIWWCRRKKSGKRSGDITIQTPASPLADVALMIPSTISTPFHEASTRGKAQPYTLQAVRDATNNFSTKIGEGGFGPVYLGFLKDGQQVAVKKMSGTTQQGLSEFSNEIDLLSTVHFKKLVSLVGYCKEAQELILLYEYMPGGDLRECLYGKKARQLPLSWRQRLHIALDAAKGLEYLHHGCNPAIFHRDVKSSNILLNDKLEAKVADFGLSKLTDDGQTHVMTMVKGTLGYLDPEYNSTGMLTDKSDVYGFGVVLLEILCGHPPIVKDAAVGSKFIVEKVRGALNRGELLSVADPALGRNFNAESVFKYAEVALKCALPSTSGRPGMNDVVQDLIQALKLEPRAQAGAAESKLLASSFSGSGLSNTISDTPSSNYSQSSSSAPDQVPWTNYRGVDGR